MKIKKTWFFAAALGAVAAASAAEAPASLPYTTNCILAALDAAEGDVTNQGRETLQVVGPVRFIFSSDRSMSRPAIVFSANSIIPPGETVRVARIRLAFVPLPGETCRFEVKDAISKA